MHQHANLHIYIFIKIFNEDGKNLLKILIFNSKQWIAFLSSLHIWNAFYVKHKYYIVYNTYLYNVYCILVVYFNYIKYTLL